MWTIPEPLQSKRNQRNQTMEQRKNVDLIMSIFKDEIIEVFDDQMIIMEGLAVAQRVRTCSLESTVKHLTRNKHRRNLAVDARQSWVEST